MGHVSASAPGKVILCGEYAVLDGAPAIAMAVNRRATVTIDAGENAAVATTGVADSADTRLLDCVCSALGVERPDAAIMLDTVAFTDAVTHRKLGIGSSAALTVALVIALSPPGTSASSIFETALAAHRRFQDGRGSGVDIAVSVTGGLVEYRTGDVPHALPWPADLRYAVLWSGVAASTSSRLASFRRQRLRTSRQALADASGVIAGLWRQGDADALIDGLRDYVAALLAFDVDHELGIFDAGHDELAKDRTLNNVVYKPSGAGGGDVGIVLGTDSGAVSRFATYAESRGFRQLDVDLDEKGACVTRGRA